MKEKIELLAPAGNKEALYAAVANGADAVYLAGTYFGARAFAGNFTAEGLVEAIEYAHERKVKVFVTTNTIVMEGEVERFLEYIGFLYRNDADAIIIQDIGMAHLVRRLYPELPVHASTQMTSLNSLDTLYLKELGFERVVYAREHSLDELETIKRKTGMESEAFVHGALCICYSGNCLFSAMTTGRSGNRGSCSQPCRMKYSLLKNNKVEQEGYLLSAKDLSCIKKSEPLLDSSVDSWKMEGRMKRSEYVATVVKHYRRLRDEGEILSDRDKAEMEGELGHIFQREYTHGYLLSADKKEIVNPKSPKNKGVPVAKLLYYDRKRRRIGLKLLDSLEVGDGLSTGEKVGRILKGRSILRSASAGEEVELDFVGEIEKGELIYKTYARSIMEEAVRSYEQKRFDLPLKMKLFLSVGEKAKLFLADEEGNSLTYEDDKVLEEARTSLPDFELVYAQMSKLGDTPYKLDRKDFEAEMEGRVFIGKSDLNRIRRTAVEELSKLRRKRYNRSMQEIEPQDFLKEIEALRKKEYSKKAEISVRCRTQEQLLAAKEEGVDRVYVDTAQLYKKAEELFEREKICYVLPDAVKEEDLDKVEKEMQAYGDSYMTNSLGLLWKYRDKKMVGDYLLNLSNRYSLHFLEAQRLTPSLEWIYSSRFEQLDEVIDKEKVEIPAYLTPMFMIMEYPLFDKNAKSGRDILELKDMKGNRTPVVRDELGKTKIFSYEVKELEQDVQILYQMGYRHYRLEFLKEGKDETRKVIRRYRSYLKEVER